LRLLNNKRGNVRVIEAFLASILLLSSLTLIPSVRKHEGNPTETLSSTARQILLSLNSNGHLSNLLDEENWTALRSCVQAFVPLTMWFNLTVFNPDMVPLNDAQITSGTAISENTAAFDCVIASLSSSFSVYIVRLQLGRLD